MEKKTRKKQTIPKKITQSYLYNAGLHYLKRYTASTEHFKTVMMRKIKRSLAHHNEPPMDECLSALETTIEKLSEMGFLNDPQYTRGMVNSLRKRGTSQKAIHARLLSKGLNASLIHETLKDIDAECIDTKPEHNAALIHARKKRLGPFSKNTHPQKHDEKAYARALASFARAGFSYDIAKTIMDTAPEDI